MGKVYLAPKGYDAPDIQDYTKAGNFHKYFEDCEIYVDRIKKVIKESYKAECPEAGEELCYPVGDGYARYVIARLRPVELVWLDVGDQWQYKYIHRLTASDIRKELKRSESLKKLFSSSRKG